MKKGLALGGGAILFAALTAVIVHSCSIEQPGVGASYEQPTFDHANVKTACSECHEKDRPNPEHGGGADCGNCHVPSNVNAGWGLKSGVTSSGGGATTTTTSATTGTTSSTGTGKGSAFTHAAGLTSCTGCHEKDRPSPTHGGGGDCASCHDPNDTGQAWHPR